MNEAILNARDVVDADDFVAANTADPEVVLPEETGNATDDAEVVSPQGIDIDNMSDEEFDAYLKKAYNGELDEAAVSPAGTGAEDEAEEAHKEEATESENVPFKAFATEDEYKAAMQEYFNAHIGDRLKGARENSERLDKIKGLAVGYYGDSDDPIKALVDDLEKQNATRAGMSREEYVRNEALEADAARWREYQARLNEAQRHNDAVIQRWNEEEARLKQSVPEFNFAKAMENPQFHQMVTNGATLGEAYYAIQLGEMQKAAAAKQRTPMKQNAQMKGTKHGSGINNMMSMSDDDFDKEMKRIIGR